MKALVSLVFVVVLIGGVYLVFTGGCGARGEVARDKVVEKIDQLLGKLDVQKKEIELQFEELKTKTGEIRDNRIRAQVRLEEISEQKKQLEEKMASIDQGLKRLQPMLQSAQESGEYTDGGKTYSVEQLKTIADTALKQRKNIKSQLDGRIKTLSDAWTKNLAFLTKQEESAKTQLANLSDRIEEITAKKSAIDAVREASLIAGPDESITDKFETLNANVDELFTEVESTMRIEEAKLDEQLSRMESAEVSIEELLRDDTDVSGTLNEIDEILGGSGN